MKLVNRTQYRDDDLRAFLLAGLRAAGSNGIGKTITIVYTRPGPRLRAIAGAGERADAHAIGACGVARAMRRIDQDLAGAAYVSGSASMGRRYKAGVTSAGLWKHRIVEGRSATLRLPQPPIPLSIAAAALVWDHEIAHLRGVQHGDMPHDLRYCVGAPPVWSAGLAIRMQEEPEAPPQPRAERMAALVVAREKRAREALARWERKAAAAARRVRELRARVRGYERRAAARSPADPGSKP